MSAKNELALAALNADADVEEVALSSGMEELKRRLEVLLGAKEAAPADESQRDAQRANSERVAESCGKLLYAALELCSDLLPAASLNKNQKACAAEMRRQLQACLHPSDDGAVTLTVKLPSAEALNRLTDSLAAFVP